MKDRIAQIIEAYSAQGLHRSGADGDLENAGWLSDYIRSFGLEPEHDQFAFRRVRPIESSVAIDGRVIEAVPLYDCTFTDAGGTIGRMGTLAAMRTSALFRLSRMPARPVGRHL
ncbi:MAG: hypothetical protein QF512_04775 [Alphaproteobacteria bacterium]|jgi:hypothetical protein|nr:hypothetical protein [Alphaproteobacteria bacterium]